MFTVIQSNQVTCKQSPPKGEIRIIMVFIDKWSLFGDYFVLIQSVKSHNHQSMAFICMVVFNTGLTVYKFPSLTCSARRCSQASCKALVLVDTLMYCCWRFIKYSSPADTSSSTPSHCTRKDSSSSIWHLYYRIEI